jgi:hypothetical protein
MRKRVIQIKRQKSKKPKEWETTPFVQSIHISSLNKIGRFWDSICRSNRQKFRACKSMEIDISSHNLYVSTLDLPENFVYALNVSIFCDNFFGRWSTNKIFRWPVLILRCSRTTKRWSFAKKIVQHFGFPLFHMRKVIKL